MNHLVQYLAVGGCGFLGAIARFAIGELFKRFNPSFPFAIFFINISGSLFLGWFLTFAMGRNVSDTWRLAIGVGFVGAYTTFSTLMYDSSVLAQNGSVNRAILNLVGSLIVGMIAVRFGIYLARGN